MHTLLCPEFRNGQPSFRHLSSAPTPVKASGGNTQKNMDLLSLEFEDKLMSHAMGGTTDNADGAIKESFVLFEKIRDRLIKSKNPAAQVLTCDSSSNSIRRFISC